MYVKCMQLFQIKASYGVPPKRAADSNKTESECPDQLIPELNVISIEKTKNESDRDIVQEYYSQPSAPCNGTSKDTEEKVEDNDLMV